MRKRPLLFFACVFLTGLAYERYRVMWLLLIPAALLLQEALLAYQAYRRRHQMDVPKTCRRGRTMDVPRSIRNSKCAGRSIILLSAFLLGMAKMHQEQEFRDAYLSQYEDGDTVTIWGEIRTFETAEYGNRCILTGCYIRINEEAIACNEVMVYTSSTHFQVGEIHEITGQFQNFSVARNTGNFDSRVFYQSQKIDFTVEEDTSRLLGKNLSIIEKAILSLKEKLKNVYDSCMEEKTAGFYNGMILGDKSNLEESIKELFIIGGISHILAISGLHVSMIGRRFYMLLRKGRIGFVAAAFWASSVILSYCYMVGSGMSAVRAVGMLLLFFLSQCMGRSYDMLNALGLMCILLLWENPFLLEYSGFWFSVLALIGVGFVGFILSQQVKRGKCFWMSAGITLTTLPVVACCYYEIPLYSPLVNMVVLPVLTPVFLLAVVGGVVGIWLPTLAKLLFLPCACLLEWYEWICAFVRGLPGASVISGCPSIGVIVGYYVVLAVGILWLKQLHTRKEAIDKRLAARYEKKKLWWLPDTSKRIMVCLPLVCLALILYPKSQPFELSFLDVGQGDGIYISTGDGTTCFIDGGSTSVSELGKYRILPFLKSKGICSIDYWFVTHADTDHISGLQEVLASGYPVKSLVVAQACPKDANYKALLEMAKENQTEVIHMKAGDSIYSQNLALTCLYPGSTELQDRNEASLVLELEFDNMGTGSCFRAIFTGDISVETESFLLEQGILQEVDLYKAAHHGSKYSNSIELLTVLSPELAVVSCSANNLYGHPAKEAIANMRNSGAEVYYTMESGQITVTENIHRKGLAIKPFLLLQ